MKNLLQQDEFKPIKIGQIVEGVVIGKGHLILYVDLSNKGVGAIFGREYLSAKDEIKKLKRGDRVVAKVVDIDNENGIIELSIKDAQKEVEFLNLEDLKERGEIINVKIQRANRGGLITRVLNFPAFIPISQLVENITSEQLQNYIGKEIKVKILSIFPGRQIVLSQKLAEEEFNKEIETLKLNDSVTGEISGVTDYGVFLKIGKIEGLVPKSEIPDDFKMKIGEKVRARVIEVSSDNILFSLK